MMATETTTRRGQVTGARATLPRKRFRFIFDLECGVAFGGNFECRALSEQAALDTLEQLMPGAANHIKTVEVLH